MPHVALAHENDPRTDLLGKIGDVSNVEVFNNQVMVAIYKRPEKTRGGIIMTEAHRDEDLSQGKVGLVVKMGALAFSPDADDKWGFAQIEPRLEVGDWVYFRASDGWAMSVNQTPCRMLDDVNVRGRVRHPDDVW